MVVTRDWFGMAAEYPNGQTNRGDIRRQMHLFSRHQLKELLRHQRR